METKNGNNGLLKNFICLTEAPVTYNRVEFRADVPPVPVGYNVFYEKDLNFTITLTSSSSGKTVTVPGFYYQPYGYDENGWQTGLKGDPSLRLRVALPDEGRWDYTATLTVRGQEPDAVSGCIDVAAGEDQRGYVRVEPNRKQNFMFDDGSVYVPFGENLGWAWPVDKISRYSAYYRQEMEKCAAQKGNFMRIWNASFGMNLMDKRLDPSYINLPSADQFDRIVETAEELDMYLDFVFFTHGQFSRRPSLPEHDWHNCTFSMENGGYLDDPVEFFTNKRAKHDTRSLMRYIVARWGYSRHILCWELFNEEDISDATGQEKLFAEWNREMIDYLHSVDTNRHMICNSSANYSDRIVRQDMYDFIALHIYNYHSLTLISDLQKNDYRAFHRPVLIGEIGITSWFKGFVGQSISEDKLELHQQHWAGLMGGGAGGGMSWFWEGIEKYNAYDTFRAAAEMAERIPWRNTALKMVDERHMTVGNPQIRALGYTLADEAYLWFFDHECSHVHRAGDGPFKDTKLALPLADGAYTLTWIEPWSGDTMQTVSAKAKDGTLSAVIPEFSRDVALVVKPA